MKSFPELTSLANPRIKNAARLQNGRDRRREGRFLINGLREIDRAVDCGYVLTEVYLEEKAFRAPRGTPERRSLLEKLERNRFPIFSVSEEILQKLAFGERGEGIIAVAESRTTTWDELRLSDEPLIAVIETIEKPGNLGAIFRSADGAGIEAVLIADPLCDLYNPNTIRSSLGTVFRIPAIVDSAENTIRELRERNIRIATAHCDATMMYDDYDWTRPTAIVLGSEAEGLSDRWTGPEMQPLRLPMLGIADSLNVSVAAAILFYEARRQRTKSTIGSG